MRTAAFFLAAALLATPQPVPGMTPAAPAAERGEAAVVEIRCGPRCKAERRAWLRHHYRPHRPPYYRPPLYRPRPHYHHHYHRHHGRGDAAAAAIIGGVIGLGIGAAIANSARPYYGGDQAPQFANPGGGR